MDAGASEELARIQRELAQLPQDNPRHAGLVARARVLLDAQGAAWIGLDGSWSARVDDRDPALLWLRSGPPAYDEIAVGFAHGVPAEVSAGAGVIARHSAAIARLGVPRLRARVWNEVAYTDWADDQLARMAEQESYDQRALADMAALARSPCAALVTELALDSAVGGYSTLLGTLLEMLVQPGFARLEGLELDYGWLRAEHIEMLAGWPGLGRLRSLTLEKASLSAPLLRQLFAQGGGGALAALDLSANDLGADAATALAECSQLAGLTSLKLGASRLGAPGLAELAGAPFWPRLRALDLSGQWQVGQLGWPDRTTPSLDAPGFALLLRELPRTQLAELALRYSALGDEEVGALAATPAVASLRRLDLFSNPIGEAGARALAASPYLAGMAHLRIYSQSLSTAGAQLLRERFGIHVSFGS